MLWKRASFWSQGRLILIATVGETVGSLELITDGRELEEDVLHPESLEIIDRAVMEVLQKETSVSPTQILGSGMSNKMWDVLLEHAKTCVLSGKLYVYYSDNAKNIGVIFNNIYELSGLIAGGQYYPADSLSDNQKVYVDTLVKKAYENWIHVIEYDSKTLLSSQNDEKAASSQSDVTISTQNYSNSFSYDTHQLTLPTLSVTLSSEQCSMNPLGAMGTQYAMQTQNTNLNTESQPFKFENLLGLAQSQLSISPFQGPNYSTYKHIDDFFTEEEIRMRSNQMLENEDMQHLLRIFNHGQTSVNASNHGYYIPSSPFIPSFEDDRVRSSGKAVVGWLKLKAALRWGIFVRKKAAERRAQLVELDDM